MPKRKTVKKKSKKENHHNLTNKNNINITINNEKKKRGRKRKNNGNPQQGSISTVFNPSVINTSSNPVPAPYEPNLNRMAYEYNHAIQPTVPNNAIDVPSITEKAYKILTPKEKPPIPVFNSYSRIPSTAPPSIKKPKVSISKSPVKYVSPRLNQTDDINLNPKNLFSPSPLKSLTPMDISMEKNYVKASSHKKLTPMDISAIPTKKVHKAPKIPKPSKQPKSIIQILKNVKSAEDIRKLKLNEINEIHRFYTHKPGKFKKANKEDGVRVLSDLLHIPLEYAYSDNVPNVSVPQSQEAKSSPLSVESAIKSTEQFPNNPSPIFVEHPNIEYRRKKTSASTPIMEFPDNSINISPLQRIKIVKPADTPIEEFHEKHHMKPKRGNYLLSPIPEFSDLTEFHSPSLLDLD